MNLTTLIPALQTVLLAALLAVLLHMAGAGGGRGSGGGMTGGSGTRPDPEEKSFLEGLQGILDYCAETAMKRGEVR